VATPKNFKHGQITGEPNASYNNAKLNQQLIDYQKAYDNLPPAVKYAGVDVAVGALKNSKVKTLPFREYAQKIVDRYRAQGRGSWWVKVHALSKFVTLHGDLSLDMVTKATFAELMEHMQQTLSNTSTSMYLRELRSIYNMAVNDEQLSLADARPFKNIKIPKGRKREVALTVENIQAIQRVAPGTKVEQLSMDVLLIMLCLGGVNMKDLVALSPPQGNRIGYYRAKTNTTKDEDVKVSLAVQPELQPLMAKYGGAENCLFDFGYRYASYQNFNSLVNNGLKRVAAKAGVDVNLTTSVIRHTWATIADELGVSENVIDYVLGHSVRGMAMRYIHRRYKAADEAIRLVLDAINDNAINRVPA
jgi:integrase